MRALHAHTHLLVGLVGALGVTNLRLEISRLALNKVLFKRRGRDVKMCDEAPSYAGPIKLETYPDTDEVCELRV